jgi:hypothetical protein
MGQTLTDCANCVSEVTFYLSKSDSEGFNWLFTAGDQYFKVVVKAGLIVCRL